MVDIAHLRHAVIVQASRGAQQGVMMKCLRTALRYMIASRRHGLDVAAVCE